jgi:hypothetical protein
VWCNNERSQTTILALSPLQRHLLVRAARRVYTTTTFTCLQYARFGFYHHYHRHHVVRTYNNTMDKFQGPTALTNKERQSLDRKPADVQGGYWLNCLHRLSQNGNPQVRVDQRWRIRDYWKRLKPEERKRWIDQHKDIVVAAAAVQKAAYLSLDNSTVLPNEDSEPGEVAMPKPMSFYRPSADEIDKDLDHLQQVRPDGDPEGQ